MGAWLLVLVLATVLTWQIVSAADDRVSDRPVAPLNVSAPVIATSDSPTTTPPTETAPSTSVTTVPSTTVGTAASTTSSTVTTATSPTTTSTSTTSTAAPAVWQTKTIKTEGGTVVVSYRPSEVKLSTAVPAPGFRVEVEHSGPPKVEVEFENASIKMKVKAEWSDGGLKVETSTED